MANFGGKSKNCRAEARRYTSAQAAEQPKKKNAPTTVGAQISTDKVYYNSSQLSRKTRTKNRIGVSP